MKTLKKIDREEVTIKLIAKESGYSINTVSRALRGAKYVSKEAREKILAVAERLNYHKDLTALSLKTKKNKTIGIIVFDSSNPFYADVFCGVEDEARKNDYETILSNTYRDPERERQIIKRMLERRVEGIIITSTQKNWEYLKKVQQSGTRIIVIGSSCPGLISIRPDDQKGTKLSTEYLVSRGCKKIIMLNATKNKISAKLREEGYKSVLKKYGLDGKVFYLEEGFENVYNSFKEIVKSGAHFDGIVCYNDIFAYAVLKVLKENGINVGKNVFVTGFDDIVFSTIIDPPLTTVRVDRYKLGVFAFKMLLNEEIQDSVVLDVELVVRNT